jgi:hypothetical protein
MWVKPDDIAGVDVPVGLNPIDWLTIVTGTLTKNGFAGGATVLYVDGIAGTGVTSNWHLIGITDTLAKNPLAFQLGATVGTVFFAGRIGESWTYDRVLTPADMKSVYELTKWRYPNNN